MPPYPWTALEQIPDRWLIALVGEPGSGKSTLAGSALVDVWATTEQSVAHAALLMVRVGGQYEIVEVDRLKRGDPTAREGAPRATLAEVLHRAEGRIVVDSLTELGHHDRQLEGMRMLREWVNDAAGRTAIAVIGVNAEGEAAGRRQLIHVCDAAIEVRGGDDGLRAFGVTKNRAGPLGTAYFRIDDSGVRPPAWPYSYSVEGRPGAYRLIAYPTKGARWDGLMRARWGKKLAEAGWASAAQYVPGYPRDVLEPDDVAERRRFAEAHGLSWLTP